MTIPASKIRLRPETPADEPFLRHLYASTRAEEMALFPWPEQQKIAFLAMQFDCQRRDYRTRQPDAEFMVVERAGEPAGRRYLARHPDGLHLMDISLLPAHRNQGLGTRLLNDLLAEATRLKQPVRLYVQGGNPALNLYRRLGFIQAGTVDGIFWLMEWRPFQVS
ncbi:MAG: N-acetyltransferase family protein [Candidatus Methylumidiphilus sp.]